MRSMYFDKICCWSYGIAGVSVEAQRGDAKLHQYHWSNHGLGLGCRGKYHTRNCWCGKYCTVAVIDGYDGEKNKPFLSALLVLGSILMPRINFEFEKWRKERKDWEARTVLQNWKKKLRPKYVLVRFPGITSLGNKWVKNLNKDFEGNSNQIMNLNVKGQC